MARDYRSVDRDTPFLLPPDMRDWLPAGHLALFIMDVLARLDTAVLHARPKRGGIGRQGYDPDMLLGLWLYASARGITSSRHIERACVEDVAFRVLCAQDAPDHTVLARFLQRHRSDMTELFAQVLALCLKAGMGKFGQVSLDGTKIRASASMSRTRSLETLRKLADAEWEKAAKTVRAEEQAGIDYDDQVPKDFTGSGRASRIQAAIASVEELLVEEIGAPLEAVVKKEVRALERVKEAERAQERLVAEYAAKKAAGTTLEGRPPLLGRGVAVRDARRNLDSASRKKRVLEQRHTDLLGGAPVKNMKLAKRNTTDPESRVMKTRKGFIQGYNAQLMCSDDFLILVAEATNDPTDRAWFVPMMSRVRETLLDMAIRTGRTDLAICMLNADSGYLTKAAVDAEGPDRLIAPGRGGVDGEGWNGTYSQGQASAHEMAEKLKDPKNRVIYKRRSATIETINAHIKDGRGMRQFTVRGKAAVNAQLLLAAMATNLTRLFNYGIALPAIA